MRTSFLFSILNWVNLLWGWLSRFRNLLTNSHIFIGMKFSELSDSFQRFIKAEENGYWLYNLFQPNCKAQRVSQVPPWDHQSLHLEGEGWTLSLMFTVTLEKQLFFCSRFSVQQSWKCALLLFSAVTRRIFKVLSFLFFFLKAFPLSCFYLTSLCKWPSNELFFILVSSKLFQWPYFNTLLAECSAWEQ